MGRLAELDKRREAILESLEKQGNLTAELKDKVMAAETMAVLEDIYLPFRPKRRTRAYVLPKILPGSVVVGFSEDLPPTA